MSNTAGAPDFDGLIRRETLNRFTRYGVVGVCLNACLYLLYLGLTALFQRPQLIMSILYIGGIAAGYLIHRTWSYNSAREHLFAAPRYAFGYFVGYFAQLSLLTALYNGCGVPHAIAQLVAMIATAIFLFALLNFWVFPQKKLETTHSSKAILAALLVFIFAILLRLAAQWDYIFSPALINDDLAVFPNLATGDAIIAESLPLLISILRSLASWLETPEKARLALTVVSGIIALQIYFLLRLTSLAATTRAIIALVAVLNPVTPSQAIFINGAHPSLGAFFALSGLLAAFQICLNEKRLRKLIFASIASASFVAGLYVSPSAVVVSLCLLPIPIIYKTKGAAAWDFGLVSAVAALPPLVYFCLPVIFPLLRYHYSDFAGFTDYSLGNIFEQIERARTLLATSYFAGWTNVGAVVLFGLIALVPFSSGYALARSQVASGSRFLSRFFICFVLLAAAGLAFMPASVVTFMADRYLTLPIILLLASALSLTALAWRTVNAPAWLGFLCGSAVLAYSIVALSLTTRTSFAQSFQFQGNLITALRAEADSWPSGAQIIVVTPTVPLFTNGYPHWSTGFVRYASGRRDIFGLVGSDRRLVDYPFLGEFDLSDTRYGYGEKFWSQTEVGSKRKTMVGIMRQRPIVAYEFSDNQLIRKNLLIDINSDRKQETYFAQINHRLNASGFDDFLSSTCSVPVGMENALRLSYQVEKIPSSDSTPELPAVLEQFLNADALNSSTPLNLTDGIDVEVNLPRNTVAAFALEFRFQAPSAPLNASQPFSDTYPRMPLLWGKAFRVDQLDTSIYKITLNGAPRVFKLQPGDEFTIRVLWKRDCYMAYFVNSGSMTYSFGASNLSEKFSVGRGYLERRWPGVLLETRGVAFFEDGSQTEIDSSAVQIHPVEAN